MIALMMINNSLIVFQLNNDGAKITIIFDNAK